MLIRETLRHLRQRFDLASQYSKISSTVIYATAGAKARLGGPAPHHILYKGLCLDKQTVEPCFIEVMGNQGQTEHRGVFLSGAGGQFAPKDEKLLFTAGRTLEDLPTGFPVPVECRFEFSARGGSLREYVLRWILFVHYYAPLVWIKYPGRKKHVPAGAFPLLEAEFMSWEDCNGDDTTTHSLERNDISIVLEHGPYLAPKGFYCVHVADLLAASACAIDLLLAAPRKAKAKPEPSAKPKPPSQLAIACYTIHRTYPDDTQMDIAERMSKTMHKEYSQGQVSKWLKVCREWYGIRQHDDPLEDLAASRRARTTPVNPARLDLGWRTDGRVPRQRKRGDGEDEDSAR